MGSDRRITISGGNQTGANIGIGTVTQHNLGAAPAVSLDALRTALDDSGPRIVALGRTPAERAALEHEVAATRRELAAEQPRGEAVRFRWDAVLGILGTALAMNADVAQITQFVIDLFR
jgi:hypothetical protein